MPRSLPGSVTGLPCNSTSPDVCCSSPARMRTSVDLPQPEGPTTQRNSRRWVSKLILSSASVEPLAVVKTLLRLSTLRMTSRALSRSKRARTADD